MKGRLAWQAPMDQVSIGKPWSGKLISIKAQEKWAKIWIAQEWTTREESNYFFHSFISLLPKPKQYMSWSNIVFEMHIGPIIFTLALACAQLMGYFGIPIRPTPQNLRRTKLQCILRVSFLFYFLCKIV